MCAAMKGSVGTIRALLSHPNIDISGKDNVSYFHYAVAHAVIYATFYIIYAAWAYSTSFGPR